MPALPTMIKVVIIHKLNLMPDSMFTLESIIKTNISVDGAFTGSFFNDTIWPFGPGNCSSAGTVRYQFNSSDCVDWNAANI